MSFQLPPNPNHSEIYLPRAKENEIQLFIDVFFPGVVFPSPPAAEVLGWGFLLGFFSPPLPFQLILLDHLFPLLFFSVPLRCY